MFKTKPNFRSINTTIVFTTLHNPPIFDSCRQIMTMISIDKFNEMCIGFMGIKNKKKIWVLRYYRIFKIIWKTEFPPHFEYSSKWKRFG